MLESILLPTPILNPEQSVTAQAPNSPAHHYVSDTLVAPITAYSTLLDKFEKMIEYFIINRNNDRDGQVKAS